MLIGIIVSIPNLIFEKFNINQTSKLPEIILFALASVLVFFQCFAVSRSAEMSLLSDDTRYTILWFLVGLVLSPPLALRKVKTEHTTLILIVCYVIFAIGFFTDFDNMYYVNKIAKVLSVN